MLQENIKSYHEAAPMLGQSDKAFEKLVGYVRFHYVMDEIWDSGKPGSKYRNALKFRRAGKTLLTLYMRNGYFAVSIVFGKGERAKFEESQTGFSETVRGIYNRTDTLHDGKWLWIDIYDDTLIDDMIRLINIKKKPNRKLPALGDSTKNESAILEKLPDTEFEIMKVVWANEPPITTNIVMDQFGNSRNWKAQAAISLLLRLVDRGFLRTEKNGKERTYYPLVAKEDYLKFETDRFINKFHDNSIKSFINTMYGDKALSEEDAEELLRWAKDNRR
jgi:predicted transcriptional regulator